MRPKHRKDSKRSKRHDTFIEWFELKMRGRTRQKAEVRVLIAESLTPDQVDIELDYASKAEERYYAEQYMEDMCYLDDLYEEGLRDDYHPGASWDDFPEDIWDDRWEGYGESHYAEDFRYYGPSVRHYDALKRRYKTPEEVHRDEVVDREIRKYKEQLRKESLEAEYEMGQEVREFEEEYPRS